MAEIASGNLNAQIPQSGGDEFAEMAAALVVFRDNGRAAKLAEEHAAREREEMAEQRRAELLSFADQFEANVKSVAESVSSAAAEMQATAETMVNTAEATGHQKLLFPKHLRKHQETFRPLQRRPKNCRPPRRRSGNGWRNPQK